VAANQAPLEHALLRERATAMAQAALTPRRLRSGADSLEPWA
jgi:hypothetical protein